VPPRGLCRGDRAALAADPRARDPSAGMLIAQPRMRGAGMWDRFLATQFKRPAAPAAD
jgi:hypothetical protein